MDYIEYLRKNFPLIHNDIVDISDADVSLYMKELNILHKTKIENYKDELGLKESELYTDTVEEIESKKEVYDKDFVILRSIEAAEREGLVFKDEYTGFKAYLELVKIYIEKKYIQTKSFMLDIVAYFLKRFTK